VAQQLVRDRSRILQSKVSVLNNDAKLLPSLPRDFLDWPCRLSQRKKHHHHFGIGFVFDGATHEDNFKRASLGGRRVRVMSLVFRSKFEASDWSCQGDRWLCGLEL
jgi:hypothetical protein